MNRRQFFSQITGIVVGGAGAAMALPKLKLQNKPIPVSLATFIESHGQMWEYNRREDGMFGWRKL